MNENLLLKLADLEEKWMNFNKKKLLLLLPFLFLIIFLFLYYSKSETINYQKIVNNLVVATKNNCSDDEFVTTIVFGRMVSGEFEYSGIMPEDGRIAVTSDCQVAFALYMDGECAYKYFSDEKFLIKKAKREDCYLSKNILDEKIIYDKINEGYIPIATVDDFYAIAKPEERIFGIETDFSGTYGGGFDKKYILVNNLDFQDIDFEPLGTLQDFFTGVLDGNNFKIYNLKIDQSIKRFEKNPEMTIDYETYGKNLGLFSMINDGTVENLIIEIEIAGIEQIGAIAGKVIAGKISNVEVSGTIKGREILGGLVGYAEKITIEKSASLININGRGSIGGFVGKADEANFNNCYSDGFYNAEWDASGFTGDLGKGTFVNSYSVSQAASLIYNPFAFDSGDQHQFTSSYYAIDELINLPGEMAKTNSDLKKEATFVKWDFDNIWTIDENKSYPKLR